MFRSKGLPRFLFLALTVCLVTSVCANIYLGKMGFSYLVETYQIRLEPCNSNVFDSQKVVGGDGQLLIVLVGDSRIAQWYPLPSLTDAMAVKRGIGGETTAQARLRVTEDVVSVRPALAVLQVGINDMKAIGVLPKEKKYIVDSCVKNIEAIAEHLRERDIETIVMTVVPPGKRNLLRRFIWPEDVCAGVEEVNSAIREMERDGVTVLDCDLFMVEAGRIKPEYAADTLHFSRRGYEELNRHLEPLITQLIEKRN